MVLNEICHAYFISKIGWAAGNSIYAGTIDTSAGHTCDDNSPKSFELF